MKIYSNVSVFFAAISVTCVISACEGPAGPPGTVALVKGSDEPAGPHCARGGTKVESGLDADESGELEASEVKQTRYVCNGEAVPSLVDIVPEEPGENCEAGGVAVLSGLDTNDNGVLEAAETTHTQYVCDGVAGVDAIIVTEPEAAGPHCAAGGYVIKTGQDTNRNGVLDAAEAQTQYICHGSDGEDGEDGHNSLIAQVPFASGDYGCVNGGILIQTGVDLNDNGTLDPQEVQQSTPLCSFEPRAGFFVMTEGGYNGNLGGLEGANAKCLAELSNLDWKGKSTSVVLNSSTVRAFLCDASTCNTVKASRTYFFARAGAPEIGGATFVSSATKTGPQDQERWDDTTHFGAGAWFHSNRGWTTASEWTNSPRVAGDPNSVCGNWSSATNPGHVASYPGNTASSDSQRWSLAGASACYSAQKLICIVDP